MVKIVAAAAYIHLIQLNFAKKIMNFFQLLCLWLLGWFAGGCFIPSELLMSLSGTGFIRPIQDSRQLSDPSGVLAGICLKTRQCPLTVWELLPGGGACSCSFPGSYPAMCQANHRGLHVKGLTPAQQTAMRDASV
jgi:hypothetical protein